MIPSDPISIVGDNLNLASLYPDLSVSYFLLTDLMKGQFFLIVDSDMHIIFQISADGSRYSRLILPNVKIPVQVEFDSDTEVVWFA